MTYKRAHIFISGSVQGVMFRGSTRNVAYRLDITGWIQNLPDGRVEALFEGEENNITEILAWCAHGPRMAEVDNVETHWEQYIGEFTDFMVH